MMEWLTLAALGKVAGKLWSGLCALINTPVGAALVAAFVFYWIGVWHEHGNLVEAVKAKDAEWTKKWDDAEKQAELDRQKRDALIKAKMEADAKAKLDALSARKDELEQQVNDYEAKQLQAADGKAACPPELTDSDDARWLRDQQRKRDPKPKARGLNSLRLRAFDR